ncbi:amino acid/polyamine transporter I [Massariosphaeria phaeospora]|uniref:Amino acid/polyamine transporter I n=1 Tax=Massariosphaeria phaeospora TaxID=100035 RepID=A0A7C8MEB8_9PLEO|nr:amino acid/polyamine transporter I [Massariosphaeria phaeospora]
MDKDIGFATTTVPEYDDGLHEKPASSDEHDSGRPFEVAASKTVFERYINRLVINNFGFTLQSGWEGVGLTFQFAWLNGGPAAIVYGAIIAGIGSTLVATALGEMASMDPTVGAQYRWSARFAGKAPEFWGFMQGWITVIAWICNCAAATSISSNTLSGLIIFNNPSYEPKAWHATLFLIALIIVPVLMNLALRRVINYLETLGGILHVIFFVAVVATLTTLAKRSTPEFVFKTLHTNSGWDNPGVAFSIGMLATAYPISSFDGVLHMIDETKEPRKQVPRAMFFATSSNAIMQFAFCVCLMFCIGDEEAVSNSILPITEVFYSATGSKAASTIMTIMMAGICMISNFNVVASVSRLVWAFARDKGLPFHQYFAYIHPTLQVPLPALMLVGTVCCLLSLINLGSSAAFNALIALPTIALYISYLIPILLLTIRQLAGRHPKYGPWQLGRWSIPIKIAAIIYLTYVIVFVPFPSSRPVTNLTMNYAAPIFLGAIFLALGDWFIRGRRTFEVPTAALEWETEDE